MLITSCHDLEMDKDFDLVVTPNKDVSKSSSVRGIMQTVKFRVQTAMADWIADPTVMADLERFIGRGNTQETGTAIRESILSSILGDLLLLAHQVEVSVVPTAADEVTALVSLSGITTDDGITASVDMPFSLSFTSGHIVGII